MKDRPILFSAPMIPPVLEGRKTQTRRILRMTDRAASELKSADAPDELAPGYFRWFFGGQGWNAWCPYGVPGDRLYVREEHYRFGHWQKMTGAQRRTRTGRQRWRFVADSDGTRFDAPAEFRKGRHHRDPATPAWHKRLARFMPRVLSRLSLELVEVRVQRLQEITEDDARAEGVEPAVHAADTTTSPHIFAFGQLWDSINGKRAPWSSNPWVWALTFRRLP